jgi:phage terminase Nu1 subunit (DNA packaging protein)
MQMTALKANVFEKERELVACAKESQQEIDNLTAELMRAQARTTDLTAEVQLMREQSQQLMSLNTEKSVRVEVKISFILYSWYFSVPSFFFKSFIFF